MGFLASIWNGFRQLLGLVLPFFSRARDLKGMGPQFRRFLHVLMLVAILACLAFLNWALDLDKLLPVRWALLRYGWAPLLFLLIYVMMWLGWWLWKLLQPEEETSDFPDIDEAWAEAVKALEQGNIDITEVPLFLVVGKSAAPEEAMFAAAQLNLTIVAIKSTVHRLRQRCRELLRAEIAHTVASVTEVDEEIRYLIQVLSR